MNFLRRSRWKLRDAGSLARIPCDIRFESGRSAMLARSKRVTLALFFAFSALWMSVSSCNAMAEVQSSFKLTSIGELPDEVRQELIANANARQAHQVKIAGVKDEALGLELTVVRLESANCDREYCPTYIKYSLKSMPKAQTLLVKCAEWLLVGDQFRPARPSTPVIWIEGWIAVRTAIGQMQITFTQIGPEISF